MQRQIKFRAWDVESNKMYPIAFPTWNGSIETRDGDYEHPTFFLSQNGPAEQGILMQFTGIKDKNGVEIYEGDIVEADNKSFSTKQKRLRYRVMFIEGSFVGQSVKPYNIQGKGNRTVHLNFHDYSEMVTSEVIGNIYESPELLTSPLGA